MVNAAAPLRIGEHAHGQAEAGATGGKEGGSRPRAELGQRLEGGIDGAGAVVIGAV